MNQPLPESSIVVPTEVIQRADPNEVEVRIGGWGHTRPRGEGRGQIIVGLRIREAVAYLGIGTESLEFAVDHQSGKTSVVWPERFRGELESAGVIVKTPVAPTPATDRPILNFSDGTHVRAAAIHGWTPYAKHGAYGVRIFLPSAVIDIADTRPEDMEKAMNEAHPSETRMIDVGDFR